VFVNEKICALESSKNECNFGERFVQRSFGAILSVPEGARLLREEFL